MSVATRIGMFDTLTARHVSEDKEKRAALDGIVKRLRKMNDYRNFILHGPWYGTSETYSQNGELVARAALKAKYATLGAKDLSSKQREHSKEEMRQQSELMLKLCSDIQAFVLSVFPAAQNRVP